MTTPRSTAAMHHMAKNIIAGMLAIAVVTAGFLLLSDYFPNDFTIRTICYDATFINQTAFTAIVKEKCTTSEHLFASDVRLDMLQKKTQNGQQTLTTLWWNPKPTPLLTNEGDGTDGLCKRRGHNTLIADEVTLTICIANAIMQCQLEKRDFVTKFLILLLFCLVFVVITLSKLQKTQREAVYPSEALKTDDF